MIDSNVQNSIRYENKAQACYDSFAKHFSHVRDYRRQGSVCHKLDHILFITLCASISGANDLAGVTTFAEENQAWLDSLLHFEFGIPSESTFRMVFALLDPTELSRCFVEWVKDFAEMANGRVTAIDGKSQRGTALPDRPHSFVHIVSAWAADSGLTLGQLKVDDKSNEITAIPELLALVDVEGSVVTIDAMGTQAAIAERIIGKKADYILALKGNQSKLHDEVANYYEQAFLFGDQGIDFHMVEEDSSTHGRHELRRVFATDQIDFLDRYKERWRGLKTIICIDSERTVRGKTSREQRYYISSLPPDPVHLGSCIRAHWGIENKVHWVLDVALREDAQVARQGHIVENLSCIRRMALNLLTKERTAKRGTANKRLKAALSKEYLLKVLTVNYSS